MKTMSGVPEPTDADLLGFARDGNQAAYGQLVTRHQTLVASLAYGICGDFARSQDIAQEAFIAAWRQLNNLEDPAKFKSWLCGITRNLGHNFVRQQTRRTDQPASSPEISPESAADTPNPHEHAVTREESAIVWRALEQLPEAYREPLILFYREHQSVERVAAALDLSEDTVKQRLSRGRGMLRNQVESLVERSLGYTTPGILFTASVLAALPATAMQIAAGTIAAAKGGVGMKASSAVLLTTSLLAVPVLNIAMSIFFGRKLLQSCRSPQERNLLRRLWWIESIVSNGALIAIFAIFALNRQGGLPLSIEALTLVSLGLISLTVIVPVGIFFKYRHPLLDFTRDARPPENASRRRRKMFFAPRRALIYRSKLSVCGLPLIDIRFGSSREQPLIRGKAVGWIALGDVAHGVLFACGGFAVAGVAVGGVAIGALSMGWLTAGMVTAGLIAVGGLANGVLIAAGHLALGTGIAIGWDAASGMLAIARHIADGPIAFAESTQHAAAHNWAKTHPVVQTFWPPLVLRIVLPGVVNAIAALAGLTAYARHRPVRTTAAEADGVHEPFRRRFAFLGLFCATVALFTWSFDAAIAHTKRRMAAETEIAIAGAREVAVAATDDAARAKAHHALGKELVAAHQFDAALAEFLWSFDHSGPTGRDYLLADLYLLSDHHAPTKTVLLERRARAEEEIVAGRGTLKIVADFTGLNYALRDVGRSLQLYERLPATNRMRPMLARWLFREFLEARRYAEAIATEPRGRIFQKWPAMQDVRWAADRIEMLAGTDHLDDARRLLGLALAYDGSKSALAIYRSSLNRAGHPELMMPMSTPVVPERR